MRVLLVSAFTLGPSLSYLNKTPLQWFTGKGKPANISTEDRQTCTVAERCPTHRQSVDAGFALALAACDYVLCTPRSHYLEHACLTFGSTLLNEHTRNCCGKLVAGQGKNLHLE